MAENKKPKVVEVSKIDASPFKSRYNAPAKKDFDKYYDDVSVKEVYRSAGIDADGVEFGVIERKLIVKKIDIDELINSQADTVGVAAYMRALAVQGDSVDNYATQVSDKIDDYSEMPDTLADTMMLGDKAKEAFDKMDPALRGNHTTIEGFLNSLSKESLEAYIKGKIDAVLPKHEKEGDAN